MPESARSLSHKRFGSLSSKTPGCLHIPVMKGKNPRSKNPEQLFTLAFLSCRRSWLGNHESSEILYGMSKNKKEQKPFDSLAEPPMGRLLLGMFTILLPALLPCPRGPGCLHSPVSSLQMLKSLLIMAQDVRRWLSEAGKRVKCPWPAADSPAPHGSSVPGHPLEAVPVGAMDTGAGQVCSQPANVHL